MKNKIFAIAAVLLLALGLSSCKETTVKPSTMSENCSSENNEQSQSAVVSPESDFHISEYDGRVVVGYHGNDKHVVIPSQIKGKTVTEIAGQGFYGCKELVSVTIPETITVIGTEAFNYCTNLQEVHFSNGLQTIGKEAFKNCISLSSISFPDTLTTLGESAFMCCDSLKEVTIPASVKNWGGSFYMSGVEKVELEEGLSYIGYGVFAVTNIKEIILPDSIQSIEFNAFNGCDNLENVVLNQGLKTISDGAFGDCSSIRQIVIPDTVTSVNARAFKDCDRLEYVIFEGDAPETFLDPNFLSVGSYYVCHYKDAKGFTSPYWNHFKTALISDDHLTITKPEITFYRDYEYFEQDGTISIIRYNGTAKKVSVPSSIDGKPVTSIGYAAFANNSNLEILHIPSSVETIGAYAFAYCERLHNVTLSEGIREIGKEAFVLCLEIQAIDLPDTLKVLGDSAFSNCRGLTHITIPGSLEEWGVGAFSFSYIETVTLQEGLTSIGNSAFHGSKLTEVVLPSTVTEIKECAFYDCNLQTVKLNEGLETIGKHAFGWNYALKEVILPASVKNITEFAFEGCRGLESVKFEGDAPSNYREDPEEFINRITYIVYYHEGAKGFTSPIWCGLATEIW